MQRRGFLAGILAAGFAPAVVGSGILMPVKKIQQPWKLIELPAVSMINPRVIAAFKPDGINFTGGDARHLRIMDHRGNVIFSADYDGKAEVYRGDYIADVVAKTENTR